MGHAVKQRNMGVALSYGRVATNVACGLLLSVALLRTLGDGEYGLYQTVAAFANYLVLLEFGMGTVMVRNLTVLRSVQETGEEQQRQVCGIWTLTLCLCAVIVAAAALFYGWMPRIYDKTLDAEQIRRGQHILALLSGFVVCSFLAQTVDGVLLAFGRYRFSALEGLAQTILRTVLILAGIWWRKSALVIAGTDLLLSGLRLGITAWYCRKRTGMRLRPGKVDRQMLLGVAPLALAVFLQGTVNQANHNVDKFLLGVMVTPEAVSLYSVALFVCGVFSTLTTVPVTMFAPAIQESVQKGENLQSHLVQPCRLAAMTGGTVLFGFAVAGRPFIRLFYGEHYLPAWGIGLMLMGSLYLHAVTGPTVSALDAKNKRMGRSLILVLTAALNVALTVWWMPMWNVMGAAAATAVSNLLGQVMLGNWHYRKALGISMGKLYRAAFRGVWPWLCLGCVAGGCVACWAEHDMVALLGGGGVFVACLLPMVWRTQVHKKSEQL